MAFPTDSFTSADLDVMIPEIWSEKINDFFRAKLAAADFFLDMSSDVPEGDQLNIPNLTEMSANSKSNATAVTLNY